MRPAGRRCRLSRTTPISRRHQVQRLRAIRVGQAPPEFAEADHRSAALYAELTAQPADSVARDSWRVTGELLEEVRLTAADDLLDASRHPWLRGRQLWLQVIVRGFWHPAGHLGEYYLSHGQADRAAGTGRGSRSTDRHSRRPRPGPRHGQLQPGLRAGRCRPARRGGGGSGRSDRAQSRRSRQRRPRSGSGVGARQRQDARSGFVSLIKCGAGAAIAALTPHSFPGGLSVRPAMLVPCTRNPRISTGCSSCSTAR